MNLWNKIFLGLIVVVAAAFFYFGARTLRIHQYWGERLEKVVGKDGKGGEIQRLADEQQKTLDAILALEGDLRRLTAARGRVWFDCQPQRAAKLDPATGSVSVVVPVKEGAPQPSESAPLGSEVFIFQDAVYDAEGKPTVPCVYLGEFSVKRIDKNQWEVQPSRGMSQTWLHEQRLARLQKTQQRNEATTWTIYQVLPKDNVFEIAARPPAETPAPGANPPEGTPPAQPQPPQPQPGAEQASQPATPGGDAVAEWKKRVDQWAEQITDYEIVFNDFYRQMNAREDAIARGSEELKTLQEDQTAASALEALFKERVAAATQSLAVQTGERKEAEDLYNRLEARQQALTTDIAETLATNRTLAAEIAKRQLDALHQIERQTDGAARLPGI